MVCVRQVLRFLRILRETLFHQHIPNPAFQASFPLAVHIIKVQQRLRLHGVFSRDAALGEMADDGIVFGLSFFQELHGRFAN